MKILDKKLSELIPYKGNPRVNDNAVLGVMESIQEYGFLVPMVIDENNVIITGHTRYKASTRLGLESVPCIVASDLTDSQVNAFRLAENRLSENAVWDDELLACELGKLKKENVDLSLTGFSFNEINELMNDVKKDLESLDEKIKEMELKSFESYDYMVVVFDNLQDWLFAQQYFGLDKQLVSFSRKNRKVGLGRVIRGDRLLKSIGESKHKSSNPE